MNDSHVADSKKSSRVKHSKARQAEFAKRSQTISMALMRYVPILHQIMTVQRLRQTYAL